jgi:hypothetical protein
VARLDGNFKVFTLEVKGVSIDNVTLEDVGQYLADFAALLGSDACPRFHSIRRSSMDFVAKVPIEREIDVKTRTFLLRTGDAPEDAIRAEARISKRLGIHRAKTATLLDQTNTKVMEIPIERPIPQIEVPALTRSGYLQGKIIRLGGKQDVVSVEIQDVDGHIHLCRAQRDVAKRLAKEMFDQTIRVHGTGRWRRTDGVWYVEDFHIDGAFEILDSDALTDVLAQLRSIPSAWLEEEDFFERMHESRTGGEVT